MSDQQPASVSTTVKSARLLPEFVGETFLGINALARTFRKSCEGVEKVVDGTDEIATLMLRQQRDKLLKELAPA